MLQDILVTGLVNGGVYALLAIGFSLIFGVARIVNIAHTAFYMLAAYCFYTLLTRFGAGFAIAARQRREEALIEPEPWRKVREDGRIGRHDLQHPLHGRVAGALRAREQPCKAAQVWYMWRNAFGQ